jgi:hypothetical protein
LSLRRYRALLVSGLALLAASGAACSAVLGLDQPTLACASTPGCADASAPGSDATIPVMDSSGSSSGGDSTAPPGDSGSEAQALDGPPDVEDGGEDASGFRCGPLASATYCPDYPAAVCCVTLDAGSATYSCVPSQSDCPGYYIECASDNDCNGNDICCFYNSAIKCEPQSEGDPGNSCANSVVCDPSLPASGDQCNTGQSCVPNVYKENGYPLPYDGCM